MSTKRWALVLDDEQAGAVRGLQQCPAPTMTRDGDFVRFNDEHGHGAKMLSAAGAVKSARLVELPEDYPDAEPSSELPWEAEFDGDGAWLGPEHSGCMFVQQYEGYRDDVKAVIDRVNAYTPLRIELAAARAELAELREKQKRHHEIEGLWWKANCRVTWLEDAQEMLKRRVGYAEGVCDRVRKLADGVGDMDASDIAAELRAILNGKEPDHA